ncbi:MAG: type II toxin-antitoxin system RelE/ParE family toxin, partial [Terriglobales bacterium]
AGDAARARFYLELLAEQGSALSMPHVRSLGGGLRELRFHLRDEQRRITFRIATDRQIVLLTTFRKQRQNESRSRVANACSRSSTNDQSTPPRGDLRRTR